MRASGADSAPDRGIARSPLGLLLLTGGQGRRMGGPKHCRPHPAGGTWGGHLVRIFREVNPGGPVQILGDPLPDADGILVPDPREGPAVALSAWARSGPPPACRWWVAPCDQPEWEAADLASWHALAEAADPKGRAWVMAREDGREQPLGGFLGSFLLPALATFEERRVRDLAARLPRCVVESPSYRGMDVDRPEDLDAWTARLQACSRALS